MNVQHQELTIDNARERDRVIAMDTAGLAEVNLTAWYV